jgi:hypothetical protein
MGKELVTEGDESEGCGRAGSADLCEGAVHAVGVRYRLR